jgi:hypothetical protein
MGADTVGAQVTSTSRMRHGALAPKKRAGIGAQPIDGTNNRRSHQPGSYRHVVENMAGAPTVSLPHRTRR